MYIENMPGCCTSAILHSFGEHGEESEVTVQKIKELCESKAKAVRTPDGELIENGKRCIFAISVSPLNQKILREAGFEEVDSYLGVQGIVHVFTKIQYIEEDMI